MRLGAEGQEGHEFTRVETVWWALRESYASPFAQDNDLKCEQTLGHHCCSFHDGVIGFTMNFFFLL